jgi:type IV secretory pathway TraG/TraD family ATPase VirD4
MEMLLVDLKGNFLMCEGRECIHVAEDRVKWQYIPLKCWYLPTYQYGVTTQKTCINIFTAVTTSNVTFISVFTRARNLTLSWAR